MCYIKSEELTPPTPKMDFKKASVLWSHLLTNQTFRGLMHSLELTDEWILDTNLPQESTCITALEMWLRRGSFFAKLLDNPKYSYGMRHFVVELLLEMFPGQLLAWGITEPNPRYIFKKEAPQIAYFFHLLGSTLINLNPNRTEHSPILIPLNPEAFAFFSMDLPGESEGEGLNLTETM